MNKSELIDQITAIEQEMFVAVKTEGECACQADIDSFVFHRRVQFAAWDECTLSLYLDHIFSNWQQGVNLMTIKYARMEDQIPPYSQNPLIEKITAQSVAWQREVREAYPKLMARSRPITDADAPPGVRSFERYFSCELETYSDDVLQSLMDHMQKSAQAGENLSLVSYEFYGEADGVRGFGHSGSSA